VATRRCCVRITPTASGHARVARGCPSGPAGRRLSGAHEDVRGGRTGNARRNSQAVR
jgi:hypothetical protein